MNTTNTIQSLGTGWSIQYIEGRYWVVRAGDCLRAFSNLRDAQRWANLKMP